MVGAVWWWTRSWSTSSGSHRRARGCCGESWRTPNTTSTSRSKRGDASATSRSSSTSRTTSKGWNFASTHTPASTRRTRMWHINSGYNTRSNARSNTKGSIPATFIKDFVKYIWTGGHWCAAAIWWKFQAAEWTFGLAPPRRSQDQRSDMIRGMELWRLMQVAMMEMETAVVMKILCVAAALANQRRSLKTKTKTRRTSKRLKLQNTWSGWSGDLTVDPKRKKKLGPGGEVVSLATSKTEEVKGAHGSLVAAKKREGHQGGGRWQHSAAQREVPRPGVAAHLWKGEATPGAPHHEPGGQKLWWKGRTFRPWRWSTSSCRNTTRSGSDKGGECHSHGGAGCPWTQQQQRPSRSSLRWGGSSAGVLDDGWCGTAPRGRQFNGWSRWQTRKGGIELGPGRLPGLHEGQEDARRAAKGHQASTRPKTAKEPQTLTMPSTKEKLKKKKS